MMRTLNSSKANNAELLGLIQERYGDAKEQAEREINDWARRLKAYSAAELTELRDDVASLSASVGELVRRQAVGGVLAVIALVLIVSFLGSKPSSSDEERLEPFFGHRLTP